MKAFKNSKNFLNKGSLMLEIIIVTSIITVSVLISLAVADKSVYLGEQSLNRMEAAFLLEEGAEGTRVVRDNGWSLISSLTPATDYYLSFSGGTWNFSTTPSEVGIFTRKVIFSPAFRDANQDLASSGTTVDSDTTLVTVSVSWAQAGQNFSKSIQFYLADIFS